MSSKFVAFGEGDTIITTTQRRRLEIRRFWERWASRLSVPTVVPAGWSLLSARARPEGLELPGDRETRVSRGLALHVSHRHRQLTHPHGARIIAGGPL